MFGFGARVGVPLACNTCRPSKTSVCKGGALLGCDETASPTTLPCASGCTDGDTVCNTCKPNARISCDVNKNLVACDDTGKKMVAISCAPGICLPEKLDCSLCMPGLLRCGAAGIEICDAAGAWMPQTACPFGCKDGKCAPCTPGAKRCEGGGIQTCGDAGWGPPAACTFGCTVGKTECNPCTASTKKCESSTNQESTCATDSSGWGTPTACTYGCENATRCRVCSPGAKRCSGGNAETCNGQGSAWTSTPCGGAGCNGTSFNCNVCKPGEKSCGDGTASVRTCNSDGSGYLSNVEACAAPVLYVDRMTHGSASCTSAQCSVKCDGSYTRCRVGGKLACRPETRPNYCGCYKCEGWANPDCQKSYFCLLAAAENVERVVGDVVETLSVFISCDPASGAGSRKVWLADESGKATTREAPKWAADIMKERYTCGKEVTGEEPEGQ